MQLYQLEKVAHLFKVFTVIGCMLMIYLVTLTRDILNKH